MSKKYFLEPSIRNSLPIIREAVDAACDTAKDSGVTGAINWSDLGVSEVRFCVDEDGDAIYQVLIEEAAPGEVGLINHVRGVLQDLDLVYPVEIITEW